MPDNLKPKEIAEARVAYEKDRREHNHWQPHWEDISHSDRLHWIFMTRGKKQEQIPVSKSLVVVI